MSQKISEKAQEKIFGLILKRPENLTCADCGTKGPRWVSLDFGVFICMDCAGAHRTLGPSVTRVRSTNIDGWYQENVDLMEAIGNATANSYWENTLPQSYNKPTIVAGLDALIRFVQEKYVKKRFIPKFECIDPKQQYMLTKLTVKPFYFCQEIKTDKPKVILGDLIDLHEQQQQDNGFFIDQVIDNGTSNYNRTGFGHMTSQATAHSLSPDKDILEIKETTQRNQSQQPTHSLPSLDILTLYKNDDKQPHMQSQHNVTQQKSNYAYLSNMNHNHNQNYNYQYQHSNQQYQIQQSQQQSLPQQQYYQQNNQLQKTNGTINIMDLYK